jgi:putative tricarboxylic transport membrane protein
MIFFGVLGYFLKKFDYDAAPLILALVLGPLMENSLRQSLLVSQGSFLIFLTRPVSATLLALSVLLLVLPLLPWFLARKWKDLEEKGS